MKKDLRQKMLKKLINLSEEEKQRITYNLQENLFNSLIWQQASVIGITLSKEPEWDTFKIIEKAWLENKQVTIPVTDQKSYTMEFYLIQSFQEIKVGSYQIYEPINQAKNNHFDHNAIDLMIVPGVVFDKKGYRIGFGKGYFDRYLTKFNHEKISLMAEFQIINMIPTNKYDIHVDYLITENGLIKTS